MFLGESSAAHLHSPGELGPKVRTRLVDFAVIWHSDFSSVECNYICKCVSILCVCVCVCVCVYIYIKILIFMHFIKFHNS